MTEELTDVDKFVHNASPFVWAQYASDLADGVAVLFDSGANGISVRSGPGRSGIRTTPHSRTALLLASFALENIVKAHMVAAHPDHVNAGFLSNEIKSHNLAQLAGQVPEFSYTDAERELLSLSTEALPYWGRYPVPLAASRLADEQVFDRAAARTFWKLFWRLHNHLLSRLAGVWDSGVGVRATQTEYFRSAHAWDAPET